jgi:sterol 14-demethylase
VPSQIPWFGNIVPFGENPITFLQSCYDKVIVPSSKFHPQFGPVFSFTMFGTEVTYLLGAEASSSFWSSHNDFLNAEDLYANLTVPVFGKGVAYDVPHKVFSEQKGITKKGLTSSRFEKYTAIIEAETEKYLERWGESGQCDLFHDLSELIIFTGLHTLQD